MKQAQVETDKQATASSQTGKDEPNQKAESEDGVVKEGQKTPSPPATGSGWAAADSNNDETADGVA